MKIKSVTEGQSLRNLFGESLCELAKKHSFVLMDCDVAAGTGVAPFRDEYPKRFFQMGIAEQNMVGAAAGYAMTSGVPVFATTFAQFGARAWEIFSLQCGYNYADVKLVLSHVGLDVGPDGASAQHLSHYALWRSIPGVKVFHPCCAKQMEQVVKYALETHGPMVILTGRSELHPATPDIEFHYGVTTILTYGKLDTLIVTAGNTAGICKEAAQKLGCGVAVISTITGNDDRFRQAVENEYDSVLVVEDAYPYGGLFGVVCERLAGLELNIKSLGVVDWGESGEADELWAHRGLSVENIMRMANEG